MVEAFLMRMMLILLLLLILLLIRLLLRLVLKRRSSSSSSTTIVVATTTDTPIDCIHHVFLLLLPNVVLVVNVGARALRGWWWNPPPDDADVICTVTVRCWGEIRRRVPALVNSIPRIPLLLVLVLVLARQPFSSFTSRRAQASQFVSDVIDQARALLLLRFRRFFPFVVRTMLLVLPRCRYPRSSGRCCRTATTTTTTKWACLRHLLHVLTLNKLMIRMLLLLLMTFASHKIWCRAPSWATPSVLW